MTPPAFRCFEHADGRKWQLRCSGPLLELRIDTGDGDWVERKRSFDDSVSALAEETVLVSQQRADGFLEVSLPRWMAFLDQLVANWKEDDPSFEAAALKETLLLYADPIGTAEALEALAPLEGGSILDESVAKALAWLTRRMPQVLPGLLLGLKHPNYDALLSVHGMLSKHKLPEALPALLSALAFPPKNTGGRSNVDPSHAIHSLGKPDGATAERVIALLDHEDFRVATAAAAVLCEFAEDDTFAAALMNFAPARRAWDGACWTFMRAAEVRRDPAMRPFLEWMLNSSRFRSAGYPQRIREALAGLR